MILLLGNHELMNLQGDFRYASQAETKSLSIYGEGARAELFSPQGSLGREIRKRFKALALIGPKDGLQKPILFVHAGLLPNFVETSEDLEGTLNGEVKGILEKDAEGLAQETSALLGDGGPFWTRRLALGPEARACQEVEQSLEAFQAYRMVVGHTAQPDGQVHERCGGRLILGDLARGQKVFHP